ncbi:MAG: hypothetical protein IJV71_01985 [Lachnospiraceae bacterium]|nr:hypothetical protein [Lachnospiraceae bacterium]
MNKLADISRQFFKELKIYKYRNKKVEDMSDGDVIKYCHWYCEDNNLVDEWWKFREEKETELD